MFIPRNWDMLLRQTVFWVIQDKRNIKRGFENWSRKKIKFMRRRKTTLKSKRKRPLTFGHYVVWKITKILVSQVNCT